MCKDLEGEQNIRNLAFFIPFNLPICFFSLICCACLILELLKARV